MFSYYMKRRGTVGSEGDYVKGTTYATMGSEKGGQSVATGDHIRRHGWSQGDQVFCYRRSEGPTILPCTVRGGGGGGGGGPILCVSCSREIRNPPAERVNVLLLQVIFSSEIHVVSQARDSLRRRESLACETIHN